MHVEFREMEGPDFDVDGRYLSIRCNEMMLLTKNVFDLANNVIYRN